MVISCVPRFIVAVNTASPGGVNTVGGAPFGGVFAPRRHSSGTSLIKKI